MAYGLKYNITFLAANNITYTAQLLLKDYTGSASQLTGGPDPFILNYQSGDDDIINAIRASEATINFYNDGLTPLSEFYSEDDQAWKIDFYETLPARLIWTGFIVQDACTELFQDAPYLVTLRATDNIGLLKDIPFDEGWLTYATTEIAIEKLPLIEYIRTAFTNTGIILPLYIYSNLFENTDPDRGDSVTADMFMDQYLFNNMFLNDDGTWQSCYEVLEAILMPLNATLMQVGGKWVVIRQTELKWFANAIPGVSYLTVPTAETLAPVYNVAIESDNVFINADATRSILRPFKTVKETFEFRQPNELLFNNTFTRHGPVSFSFFYNITSEWTIINTCRAYIAAVPNAAGDVVRRYILIETLDNVERFLRFNPIEVVQNIRFNFQMELVLLWATPSSNNNFHTRFILLTDSGDFYTLSGVIDPDGTVSTFLHWTGPHTGPIGLSTDEVVWGISAVVPVGGGDPPPLQTAAFNLESLIQKDTLLPGMPADGVLLIDMSRMEHPGGVGSVNLEIRNIKIEFENVLNEGDRNILTSQTHLQTFPTAMKNKRESDILIDDSPVNLLAGTLFNSLLTDFGETVGEIHYTRSALWHRGASIEARRLGEITTLERSQIQSKPRAIIEGTLHFTDMPTPLNVFQVDTLPDLNLIPGVMEVNYGAAICNIKLWEIYETGVTDAVPTYRFDYIKQLS